MTKIDIQEAINVLSTWIAFEILSPQTFSEMNKISSFGTPIDLDDGLPWHDGTQGKHKKERIFYHIILGAVKFDKAVDQLIEKYADQNFEKQASKPYSFIAVVMLDEYGRLMPKSSVGISSFAWGLAKVLNDETSFLSGWSTAESELQQKVNKLLQSEDKNGRLTAEPVTKEMLDAAYTAMHVDCQIPQDLLVSSKLAIKYKVSKSASEPQGLLLNSFYLEDLIAAKELLLTNRAPENLLKYLAVTIPEKRYNIFKDNDIIAHILSPQNIPLARWPSPGKHPLILLQQAAINAAKIELKDGGIFAINGPPGTGKTTLLRDIVADVIFEKAKVMAEFINPETAFTDTGNKIKITDKYDLSLHKIDERLKNFEILIASTNNKAVENVSTELPAIDAIDSTMTDLRYFNNISDTILDVNTWGMISAVLGSTTNCREFCKDFWFNDDHSIFTYLLHAVGKKKMIAELDENTKKSIDRIPKVVTENNPPESHHEALKKWHVARKKFISYCKKMEAKIAELQQMKIALEEIADIEKTFDENKNWTELHDEHDIDKPHWLKLLLRFRSAKKWQTVKNNIVKCQEVRENIDNYFATTKPHIVDYKFFNKSHNEKNQTSPWCDAQIQQLRAEVFAESIKLSKAFIDAAAQPLRNNIGIFVNIISKNIKIDDNIQPLLSDLWSSFFTVVPTVSTTFASTRKLLGSLEPNSIGYLLIDEAGQAVPQAAIGGIMRAKRIIVTGDPLQIEPVVPLPNKLTNLICQKFSIQEKMYNAPTASVQTLADNATPYFAEFITKYGDRRVGFPLLVHRRCAEPMFSIANKIAYENYMVLLKQPKTCVIKECLGESTWFNVQSRDDDDKWCNQEGKKVIDLLSKLKAANIYPDLYIVAPFKIIAINLTRMISESDILKNWLVEANISQWLKKHVGTVHTVQGREASAVIIVLGAQEKKGSRIWASKAPNILNVAVTRAKNVMYVIGNTNLWRENGVFSELYNHVNHVDI